MTIAVKTFIVATDAGSQNFGKTFLTSAERRFTFSKVSFLAIFTQS